MPIITTDTQANAARQATQEHGQPARAQAIVPGPKQNEREAVCQPISQRSKDSPIHASIHESISQDAQSARRHRWSRRPIMSRRIFVPQRGVKVIVPEATSLPPIVSDPRVVDELIKRHPVEGIKSSVRFANKSVSSPERESLFVSFGLPLTVQPIAPSNQSSDHDETAMQSKERAVKTRKRPRPLQPLRLAFDVVLRELATLNTQGRIGVVQQHDIQLRELPPSPVNPYKLLLHFKSEPGQERPLMPSLARNFKEENCDNRLGYEEPIRDRNKDWREDLWTKIIPAIDAKGKEPPGDRLVHNMVQVEQSEHVIRGIVLKEHVILRKAHRIGARHAIVTVFGIGIAGRAYVQASRYPRYINVRAYLPSKRKEFQLMLDGQKLVSLFRQESRDEPLRAGKKRALCETIVRMLHFDVEIVEDPDDGQDSDAPEPDAGGGSRPATRSTDGRPATRSTDGRPATRQSGNSELGSRGGTRPPGTPNPIPPSTDPSADAANKQRSAAAAESAAQPPEVAAADGQEILTLTISAGLKANATDQRIARLLLNSRRGRRASQASMASYLDDQDEGNNEPVVALRKQGLLTAKSMHLGTHLVVVSVYNPPKRQSTFLVCVYDPQHCYTYQMSVSTREVATLATESRPPGSWSHRRKVRLANHLLQLVDLLNFDRKTAIQIGTRVGLPGPAICHESRANQRRHALAVMPGRSAAAKELRDSVQKRRDGVAEPADEEGGKAVDAPGSYLLGNDQEDDAANAMNRKMPRRLIGKGPKKRPLVHGAQRAVPPGAPPDSCGVLCIFELHEAFRGPEWACLRLYVPSTSANHVVLVTFQDIEAYTKLFMAPEKAAGSDSGSGSDSNSDDGESDASDSSSGDSDGDDDDDGSSSSDSSEGSYDDAERAARDELEKEKRTEAMCRALVRNCLLLDAAAPVDQHPREDALRRKRAELCRRAPDLLNRCIYRSEHAIPQMNEMGEVHACTVALFQEEGKLQFAAQIHSNDVVVAVQLDVDLANAMLAETAKLSVTKRDVHVSVLIEELNIVERDGALELVHGMLDDEDESGDESSGSDDGGAFGGGGGGVQSDESESGESESGESGDSADSDE